MVFSLNDAMKKILMNKFNAYITGDMKNVLIYLLKDICLCML
jgi:hypothetical protein